jgi:alkylhydroperoxidase family enzyme
MRLEPIDRPPTWTARVASWLMKRQLGKVITPARVVYNRVPAAYDVAYAMIKAIQRGLVLDPQLRLLVQTWPAMLNSCHFCVDIARAQAVMADLGLEKFDALPGWRTSPLFDDRERAALAYVEEATRRKQVSDETFAGLRKHFGEREIVEITYLNAIENFYNLINLPLEIEEDGLCAIQQERRAAIG